MNASVACHRCGDNMHNSPWVEFGHGVDADHDPDGVARMEIVITCAECDQRHYAFVAVDSLQAEVEP